jgi:hypothetical protein
MKPLSIICPFILIVQLLSLYSFGQTGIVFIRSSPEGSHVIINGNDTYKNTPYQESLAPGTYNYTLKNRLYHDWNGHFTIMANEIERLDITMQPNFGFLKLYSNPGDAEVFLDEMPVGKTPLLLEKIQSGKHRIEIRRDRYNTITDIITVEDGKLFEKTYDMVAGFGTIGILAQPDADIFINGERIGNRLYTGRIDAGTYTIEARKEKYGRETKNITIEAGQEYTLNFELKPVAGTLSVLSEPPEASIYIDNQLVGKSPQIINDLLIGTYQLQIELPGYREYREQISIEQDQTTSVHAKLLQGNLVSIHSKPEGAFVWVDGRNTGITPLEILLQTGSHNLKLEKPGYAKSDTTIRVTNDGELRFTLKKQIITTHIETLPKGAQVQLNQMIMGKTPLTLDLFTGDYPLKIEKKGFETIEKTISLMKQQEKLSFNLIPDKPRKKSEALIYSILFPGAGQSYLARNSSPLITGVAAYGIIAGGIIFHGKAVSSYDNYLAEQNPNLRGQLKDDWKSQKKLSDTLISGGAAIWAANLVWILLLPDDTNRFTDLQFIDSKLPGQNVRSLGIAFKF